MIDRDTARERVALLAEKAERQNYIFALEELLAEKGIQVPHRSATDFPFAIARVKSENK